jgi:hypothetical protein
MQTGAQEGAPRSAFVGAEPPKGVRLAAEGLRGSLSLYRYLPEGVMSTGVVRCFRAQRDSALRQYCPVGGVPVHYWRKVVWHSVIGRSAFLECRDGTMPQCVRVRA